MIRILGIGTGEFKKLTIEGLEMLEKADDIVLQTDQIPLADDLRKKGITFSSLDDLYNEAEDFDELRDNIGKYLAGREGDTLFCVLGSIYTNEFVKILKETGVRTEYTGGTGFAEEALDLIGPGDITDNYTFTTSSNISGFSYDGNSNIVITEIDNTYAAFEVADFLGRYFSMDKKIVYISRGKREEMALRKIYDINDWNYSSSLYISRDGITEKEGFTVRDLLEIMDRLLGKNGCEWDRAQDHRSLRQYLLEETYEVIDAIDREDEFMLQDELGDLLYQIVFHSKLAEEHGQFDMLDVSTSISKKMIKRHPHIFSGDKEGEDWEEMKKKEKSIESTGDSLKDIPEQMGALLHYQKILRKLLHLEKRTADTEKAKEEILKTLKGQTEEPLNEDTVGELLGYIVELAFANDINAEIALNGKIEKVISQYR